MDDQGGGLFRLTPDLGDDLDPSWAPDGSQLAYTHRNENLNFDIQVDRRRRTEPTGIGELSRDRALPGVVARRDADRVHLADARIMVMPARGGAASEVGIGTDPNWGPLPPPVGAPESGRTITFAPSGARVLVAPATRSRHRRRRATDADCGRQSSCRWERRSTRRRAASPSTPLRRLPTGPAPSVTPSLSGGVFTVTQGTQTGAEPTLELRAGSRPCSTRGALFVDPGPRVSHPDPLPRPVPFGDQLRTRGRAGDGLAHAQPLRRHDVQGVRGHRPRPRLPAPDHGPSAGRALLSRGRASVAATR